MGKVGKKKYRDGERVKFKGSGNKSHEATILEGWWDGQEYRYLVRINTRDGMKGQWSASENSLLKIERSAEGA